MRRKKRSLLYGAFQMLDNNKLRRVIKKLGQECVARYIGRYGDDPFSKELSADELRAVSGLDSVIRFGSTSALNHMLDAKFNQIRLLPTEDAGSFMIDGHPLFRLNPNRGAAQITLLQESVQQNTENKPLDAIISHMRKSLLQRCRSRGYAVVVLGAIQDEKRLFLRGYGSQEHFAQCDTLRAQVREQLSASLACVSTASAA